LVVGTAQRPGEVCGDRSISRPLRWRTLAARSLLAAERSQ